MFRIINPIAPVDVFCGIIPIQGRLIPLAASFIYTNSIGVHDNRDWAGGWNWTRHSRSKVHIIRYGKPSGSNNALVSNDIYAIIKLKAESLAHEEAFLQIIRYVAVPLEMGGPLAFAVETLATRVAGFMLHITSVIEPTPPRCNAQGTTATTSLAVACLSLNDGSGTVAPSATVPKAKTKLLSSEILALSPAIPDAICAAINSSSVVWRSDRSFTVARSTPPNFADVVKSGDSCGAQPVTPLMAPVDVYPVVGARPRWGESPFPNAFQVVLVVSRKKRSPVVGEYHSNPAPPKSDSPLGSAS